jgi:uncharacterized protein YfbU (UPF0304 family)
MPKPKIGRPLLQIDPKQVEELAAINCSLKEMAAVLDCERTTLYRRFATVIEKGREVGKQSLKRKMWEVAMAGNATMLIWLSKNMLGYSDAQPSAIDEKVQEFSDKAEKINAMTKEQLINMTQKLLNDLIAEVVREKAKKESVPV